MLTVDELDNMVIHGAVYVPSAVKDISHPKLEGMTEYKRYIIQDIDYVNNLITHLTIGVNKGVLYKLDSRFFKTIQQADAFKIKNRDNIINDLIK